MKSRIERCHGSKYNISRRLLIRCRSEPARSHSTASLALDIGKESPLCFSRMYLWVSMKHAPLKRSLYPIGENAILIRSHWRSCRCGTSRVRPHSPPSQSGHEFLAHRQLHIPPFHPISTDKYLRDGVLQGSCFLPRNAKILPFSSAPSVREGLALLKYTARSQTQSSPQD